MSEPDHHDLSGEEIKALVAERKILEHTIQRMVDGRMQELLDAVVKSTTGDDGKGPLGSEKRVQQMVRVAVEKFFEDHGIFRTR